MMFKFDEFADNVAIICEDGESISYTELQSACDELSARIKTRSIIFNLCANEKGSLLGYVTFINAGIVPVMLDATLDKELLSALIESYSPDYLWVPQTQAEFFGDCEQVFVIWDYTLLKTPYTNVYPLHDELALLLTTSGSTGSPKFVRQSYTNIRANTESIVEYLQLESNERPITTMPMSYTYGLSIINSHLWVGASVILTQKTLMQKEFWQQFKDHGATSFGGVPYVYEMLDKLRFFRMDLPSLRAMTQAGGKLSPELHKKFAEYAIANNKKFIVMYGQTEATARMSYLPAEKSLEKYGSMGIAIPGGEFSLADVDGNEIIESDKVGELVYKGANVTLGYAQSGSDLLKGDERFGVLITGDMAKRDKDGFYYIVGRKKRFLKIFGSRVNLDETERLLNSAFTDIECACGGVDDRMTVFITNPELAQSIISFLVEKTGLNRIAFKVIHVEKIPRNEAGKILYSELNKIDV
ncbi:MAG: AMP-binding protein [Oscillospiraceae bacterium]|nr:AMP-binding protein [Oscillospiraceae bacterium]